MARQVDIELLELIERSNAPDAILVFVRISHAELQDDILLVRDDADYERDGETWNKSGFQLTYITDTDQPGKATISFPNVDSERLFLLRHVIDPARVSMEIASAAYFDLTAHPRTVKPGETLETFWPGRHLYLTEVKIDERAVSGTLRGWDYRQEIWPGRRATQKLLPGLYVR